ncbi:MAG: hypothetical protein SGJ01_04265 [Gemmatimonadota bacterium]|nr:hypothetical protein [Gemmatimonadota bacterium]
MTVVSGEGQQGTVGQPLDSALAVYITDKFGQAVPGVLVRFAAGSGSLAPIAQTTGPGGQAVARWILPTTAGLHTATVRASALDSIVFHARATPAAPASVALVVGDTQTSGIASALATAVVVLVRDQFGNPVGGATVAFVPAAGSGTAAPVTTHSDSLGQARTSWTLGGEPGLQALAVRVDSLRQLRVQAQALDRPAPASLGLPLYPGEATWTGDQATVSERGAPGRRRSPGPIPALRCWRNALGAAVLQRERGTEELATTVADDGAASDCEEPALRW